MDEVLEMVRENIEKISKSSYEKGVYDAFNIVKNTIRIPLNEQMALMVKLGIKDKEETI